MVRRGGARGQEREISRPAPSQRHLQSRYKLAKGKPSACISAGRVSTPLALPGAAPTALCAEPREAVQGPCANHLPGSALS